MSPEEIARIRAERRVPDDFGAQTCSAPTCDQIVFYPPDLIKRMQADMTPAEAHEMDMALAAGQGILALACSEGCAQLIADDFSDRLGGSRFNIRDASIQVEIGDDGRAIPFDQDSLHVRKPAVSWEDGQFSLKIGEVS